MELSSVLAVVSIRHSWGGGVVHDGLVTCLMLLEGEGAEGD